MKLVFDCINRVIDRFELEFVFESESDSFSVVGRDSHYLIENIPSMDYSNCKSITLKDNFTNISTSVNLDGSEDVSSKFKVVDRYVRNILACYTKNIDNLLKEVPRASLLSGFSNITIKLSADS